MATSGGEVELAASAAAWAPPGVSAATPAPSLRVAVSPTLAVLNLSNVTSFDVGVNLLLYVVGTFVRLAIVCLVWGFEALVEAYSRGRDDARVWPRGGAWRRCVCSSSGGGGLSRTGEVRLSRPHPAGSAARG